ncbi:hypothetical protein Q3O97_06065 [Ralstonia pseudosolanacearum]|uniref:hypothetical protein n=1 Tax=Ralstonia pseudosolanacearum TaxID=1310165 RepID=UPI0026FC2A64|nr:hypothetical protein [Ralstonia pseudosolanacearum]MDO3615405.1 hypothetical protein [Ralstonia pseudosolanacearum]
MAEQLINAAQSTLAKALTALSRRADRVHTQLSAAHRIRTAYLAAQVGTLLPTVSRAVMHSLQARLPAFVNGEVMAEFRRGRKFLALFPRKQTHESLKILQYALTAYLSQIRYQELKEFDAEIAHLRSYLTDLQRARELTANHLRVLQVVQDRAAPVPCEALPLLSRIASAGGPQSGHGGAHRVAGALHDQDTNLCAFALADFPSRLGELLTCGTATNAGVHPQLHRTVPGATELSAPVPTGDAFDALLATA